MKNRLKIITAIMLTLIFCMQPVCNVQATEESNLSEAQQEKKTLENDLQKAKELIDSLKGSKEDIQSEVEKLDKQLNEISGKVKELESRLSKKRQEIADTESALNKAKEQEKKQYRNMKKRIQFMYENGQTSYVEMLLSADSFTDFLNAGDHSGYAKDTGDRLCFTAIPAGKGAGGKTGSCSLRVGKKRGTE